MKHLIVGTAGHVDHGKTALIKSLTGTDTDRLKEEKRRGISIDIGFAAIQYGDELTLGIVDVPGHERFLKNMLAGTGGIDFVMLVIAADEGIMPQTREHFEMLQCFGVKQGIVVLSKVDKVEADWLELVEEEIRSYVLGTFLAEAPICRVSAITGGGIGELRDQLRQEALKIGERDRKSPFRLWIDRAFNLKGQGLIVTGSVLTGMLRAGDPVVIYPQETEGRVREIETHNQKVDIVGAGQRASFKLTGAGLADVDRGMFLSEPGRAKISAVWDAVVVWKNPYPSGTRIRLHLGTGEFIGRLSFYKTNGTARLVRLHLEKPIAAGLGDQGILRRYSPQNLIGGVTLLAPGERGQKRTDRLERLAEAFRIEDLEAVQYALLTLASEPPSLKEWVTQAGYVNEAKVRKAATRLLETGKVKKAGGYYVPAEQVTVLQARMRDAVLEHHRERPSEPGISRETLRQKIALHANIADWFLQDAAKAGLVKLREEFVSDPSHAEEHGKNKEALRDLFDAMMKKEELVEVTPQWLSEKMQRPLNEIKPFFDTLIREGTLVRIAGVHVYRKTIQYIGGVIQEHFRTHATLTVGELRDLLNTSRRLVVPFLEYCDSHKYTTRNGDARTPGSNIENLSE